MCRLPRCLRSPPPSSTTTTTRPPQVPGVTYLELMEHVKQLYPSAGPFVLKFLDK